MKKIFILIGLLFLTGCSVEYHIDFVDNDVFESLTFSSFDSTYDSVQPIPAFKTSSYSVEDSVKLDGVEYYDVNTKDGKFYFNYKFDVSDYGDSYSANTCYDYFRVFEEDNEYVISTDKKFKCFFPGRGIDKVDIVITTNHEVLFNNADEVVDDSYIWHITEENKDDANIQISFSKKVNKTFFERALSNNTIKIILVVTGIALLILIFSWIIYIRYKRINRV